MLFRIDSTNENTYGFDFQSLTRPTEIATIKSIGIEHRNTENNYFWDCISRPDKDTFIFQYTLSGCGEIKIAGKIYSLPEGHAFMVAVPEDCQYYLPETSSDWKFVFITLHGIEAKKCWDYVNSYYGYVFKIPLKRTIIQQLIATYMGVIDGQFTDMYRVSHKAFEFLTYCYRHFETKFESTVITHPADIEKALTYIKENFAHPLNIDDISEYSGLSKSYLTKKFKRTTGSTPVNYLNEYRIEKGIYLLQHTQKTIKEISAEVGFNDPNYFCKVFRKKTGISPGLFQKTKATQHSLDFLITDDHGIIDLD